VPNEPKVGDPSKEDLVRSGRVTKAKARRLRRMARQPQPPSGSVEDVQETVEALTQIERRLGIPMHFYGDVYIHRCEREE